MKVQAIRKACLRAGRFIIIDAFDGQWISDGFGSWTADGIVLSEDIIPALFDLDGKIINKINIRRVDMRHDKRLAIYAAEDEYNECADMGAVWHMGEIYRALDTPGGLVFLDVEELKPCAGDILRFHARTNAAGQTLIAAYGSLLISGCIAPVSAELAAEIMDYICKISGARLATPRKGSESA